jgi:hypothetical protein
LGHKIRRGVVRGYWVVAQTLRLFPAVLLCLRSNGPTLLASCGDSLITKWRWNRDGPHLGSVERSGSIPNGSYA